ncbi:MAG: Panacea domain-containing protein [Bryobacteraceae bacterium]|jgi:uncharacterized phage-associated protein
MSFLKLIKLLYLADREALLRWGRPITTDCYVSMDQGPVVSRIYELIRDEPMEGQGRIWREFISAPSLEYEVELFKQAPGDELSVAEEALLDEVFAEHGSKSRWALVNYCHSLPEWQDPQGSALGIEYRDILQAGQKTPTEIAAVLEELESLAYVESLLRPV